MDDGILQAVRRVGQAPGGEASLGRQEAGAARQAGLVRERRRCGCCRAVYALTERGRAMLARLAADERGS